MSSVDPPKLPAEIYFVDDRLGNVESVSRGLQCHSKHGIELHCFHYTAASMDFMGRSLNLREKAIANVQIDHFINACLNVDAGDCEGLASCLLNDQEAELLYCDNEDISMFSRSFADGK